MVNKKGQAAMEFLMTYGWAILAAIIAIGVLAYFGVFSPGKFTPSATVLNPPLYANAWNIDEDGTVNLEVRNNGGEDYTLTGSSITWTSGATGSCTNSSALSSIGSGALATIPFDCSAGFGSVDAGDAVKGDISVSYVKSGSSLGLTSTGTIAGTASA